MTAAAAVSVIAAAFFIIAIAVTIAFAILFEDCGNDLDEVLHVFICRGNEFFGIIFLIDDDLHDIDAGLTVAFLVLCAFAVVVCVNKNCVLIALVIKIIDNIKLKLVSVIINEGNEISFFTISHSVFYSLI